MRMLFNFGRKIPERIKYAGLSFTVTFEVEGDVSGVSIDDLADRAVAAVNRKVAAMIFEGRIDPAYVTGINVEEDMKLGSAADAEAVSVVRDDREPSEQGNDLDQKTKDQLLDVLKEAAHNRGLKSTSELQLFGAKFFDDKKPEDINSTMKKADILSLVVALQDDAQADSILEAIRSNND